METRKIKAVGNKILVKKVSSQEKSVGGIILPDSATNDQAQLVTVVDVGPGYCGEKGVIPNPIDLTVGSTIIIARHSGQEVKVNDEKYQIVSPEEVLAIVY